MSNDPISEALDIVPLEHYEKENRVVEIQPQNDFELARNNIKDIIAKTTPSLQDALDYAYNANSDKGYSALSALVKTLVDANKQLVELSKLNQETTKLELTNDEMRNRDPNQVTKIENNLYVTNKELLQILIDERRKQQNE